MIISRSDALIALDEAPPAEKPWKPLMTAEQHRRQAELLLRRGGEDNGALALHHEQIACLIDARNGVKPAAEDAWNEADHPRGQPGNAGQFGSGGGGGGKKAESAAAPDPNQLEMVLEPKFRTKTEHVKHLLTREGGTTVADVLKATGWPSVSMPQMAKVLGMRLEKVKEGGVTKYRGIPLTDAEKQEAKQASKAAKEAKEAEERKRAEEAQKAEQQAKQAELDRQAEEYAKKVAEQTAKRRATKAAKKAAAQKTTETKRTIGKTAINATSKVSELFVMTIAKHYEALPEKVRSAIEKTGATIELGETTPDAFPSLKGQQPRGWPPGKTWDHAPGVFSYGGGLPKIGVAEKYLRDTDNKLVANWSGPGVLRHEAGHAYDYALGRASESPEFKKAYAADVAKMNRLQKATATYLLQDPPAGQSEAFAELFACLHSDDGYGPGGRRFALYFPETTKVMKGLL